MLIMAVAYIYFYRNYKFNQRGLYRKFDIMEYVKLVGSILLVLLYTLQDEAVSIHNNYRLDHMWHSV